MKIIKRTAIFLLALVIAVSFAGCCRTKSSQIAEAIEAAWNGENTYDESSFLADLDTLSSFKVKSVEKSEKDFYLVTCEVTSPDFLGALKEYQNSIKKTPSDDEMNNQIKKFIGEAELKTTEQTVNAFKTDTGWHIEFSEGFIDAMCGYSYSYSRQQISELLEGGKAQ